MFSSLVIKMELLLSGSAALRVVKSIRRRGHKVFEKSFKKLHSRSVSSAMHKLLQTNFHIRASHTDFLC